jgi:hypothetical protein
VIRLEVEQGEARGRVVERDAAEVTLGRAPNADLLLPDWHVSGAHGVLRVAPDTGAVTYRDLRSTNGSRVRRGATVLPIDASVQFERELQPGDCLDLGDPSHAVLVRVRFELARPAFLPPTASALSATLPSGELQGPAQAAIRGATAPAMSSPRRPRPPPPSPTTPAWWPCAPSPPSVRRGSR